MAPKHIHHRKGRLVSAIFIGLLCALAVSFTAMLFVQIGMIRLPAALQKLFEPTSATDSYAAPLTPEQQQIYSALPTDSASAANVTTVELTAQNALELLAPLAAAGPGDVTRSDRTVYYIAGGQYELDTTTVYSGKGWTVTQYGKDGAALYKYVSDGRQTKITDLSNNLSRTVSTTSGPDGLAAISQLSYLIGRDGVTVDSATLSQTDSGNTLELRFSYDGTSRAETWDVDLGRGIVTHVKVTDGGVTVMESTNVSVTGT